MKNLIIAIAALGALSTAAFAEPRDERYSLIDKWNMQGETAGAQVNAFAAPVSASGQTSFEKARIDAMLKFGPGGSSSSN